jgi:DNA-binding transcriptional regulator YiaG
VKPSEIKRIRMKLGLTQERMARLFGLSGKHAVSNIETGFRNPNSTIVMLLAILDKLPGTESKRLMKRMFKEAESGKEARQ